MFFRDLLAALTLLTRLPMGRLAKGIPADSYSRVVHYWPLVGYLTAGWMAGVLWSGRLVFPITVAVTLAVVARVLLTGALHEDGLGDVCDGFGAGGGAQRILAIMKDSHVGSYAMLGYTLYFLLFTRTLCALPLPFALQAILVADPLCKALSAQLVNVLPYARPGAQSKMGVVYSRRGALVAAGTLFVGLLPLGVVMLAGASAAWLLAVLAPLLCVTLLCLYFRHRIGGYTGDCLGATFLLSELSYYLMLLALRCCGL